MGGNPAEEAEAARLRSLLESGVQCIRYFKPIDSYGYSRGILARRGERSQRYIKLMHDLGFAVCSTFEWCDTPCIGCHP